LLRGAEKKLNEIIVDFAILEDYPAIDRILELNIVEIFMAELGRFKRIIAGMGLNPADGEDVIQDVSIKALKPSVKFRTKQEVIRWLIKVTINQCLIEHRHRQQFRRKAGEILELQQGKLTIPADKKAIIAEELEIVRESLQKLNESLLELVVLRYFCDMDSKEIGEILEQSPSTVRSRLREARMILAKGLLERAIEQ
jgi:RNA polymerase sigma factor (sigma-70 family)